MTPPHAILLLAPATAPPPPPPATAATPFAGAPTVEAVVLAKLFGLGRYAAPLPPPPLWRRCCWCRCCFDGSNAGATFGWAPPTPGVVEGVVVKYDGNAVVADVSGDVAAETRMALLLPLQSSSPLTLSPTPDKPLLLPLPG